MRILLINKFYYNRGGSEKYFFELENLLKNKGHEVRIFSMAHPQNLPNDSAVFVKNKDFGNQGLLANLKGFFGPLYNWETKRLLKKLIGEFKPQAAHLNNINFQLTTSAIDVLKKEGIPIVMTLHDYQLVCPNHLLFRNERFCNYCLGGKFYHCAINRCYKNSLLQSFIASIESYFNHIRKAYDKIDHFISPSLFLKQKMVESGFSGLKITVLPNFLSFTPDPDPGKENFYLYAGRLTADKGILDLIGLFSKNPQWQLRIIGDGPLQSEILKSMPANIKYHGQLSNEQVQLFLIRAKALIMPSKWPENCPYIVLEAMKAGTAVIALRVGGLPEIIENNINGILTDNLADLARVIGKIETDPESLAKMSAYAKLKSKQYDSDSYYTNLLKIYQKNLRGLTKL